ncbi:MAG: hypothetical protein ACLFP1_07210 [Candidatus Goldiibacteriota bacterium]
MKEKENKENKENKTEPEKPCLICTNCGECDLFKEQLSAEELYNMCGGSEKNRKTDKKKDSG